jgi:hypothetical protein
MSEPMVARNTRKSVQRENASAAIFNLEKTQRERDSIMSNKNGR